MSDFNIDANTMNKLKDMMNKGDLSDMISQIPPEMIQNFSAMMQNNAKEEKHANPSENTYDHPNTNSGAQNFGNSGNQQTKNNQNGFDFSNIDMNTILKMKSVMEKMNSTNDPRSNLLYSLKPYLRDGRKEKLDQYANLMNFAKIAELLKNDNKENKNNG